MQVRADRFRQGMVEAGIDAAFLVKPHNVFYLAGYSSVCSGVLVLSDSEPILCTLWLDTPEARGVCPLPRVTGYVFPKETLMGRMIKLSGLHERNVGRIGIEKDFLLVRDYELLLNAFPRAEIVDVTPIVNRLRAIKSPDEIAKMRTSASIADKAMEAALKAVRPGVTEIEIAAEAEYVMRKLGSERPAFGTFVASGERTLLAHPYASKREILPNDPVVIDLGATWEGYASDLCRTTFAGRPTAKQQAYLDVVIRAQEAAVSELRDGAVSHDVFNAACEVFQRHKLGSLLPNDIGYGVGLRQSEFFPIIERNSKTVLKKDMVVALLQTTAYKRDMGGLRVEDTYRVTKDGAERLTSHTQPRFE